MDLSNPLALITPTLDAEVLLALSATTSWTTGRGVHRLAGTGSADGVRKVLQRLVAQGIVLSEEHPQATLYALNREHVGIEAILSLTRLREQLLDKIVGALRSWEPAPLHASLFGSFARNEADADSDIDILVVFPTDADGDRMAEFVASLAAAVHSWTGNRTHIVDVTRVRLAEMINGSDPLVASWRADQVHLFGTRLPDLLRGVQPADELMP